jgi:tetratricopeptide (TPR) repeat protein
MLILAAPPADASPPLWGTLRPGPYAVGFRSTWQRDDSRRYNITFDDRTTYANGKSPRPILINVWYPARAEGSSPPMRHRDYLEIGSDDPQLSRLAARLADYERTIVCKELMGKEPKELTDKERRLLDGFWDTPTASHRGAPPQDGKFPLVVYHAGAQSSYEDNAVLCEVMASHGYVVVGSAFQDVAGRFFNISGGDGAARDFEFLIAHAGRLPNVDWQHIGLIGHSAGAQAALYFRAHDASAVDAVVSLDTTQDYHSLSTHGWDDLVKYLLEHVENMNGPLLVAANDHAIFQLADAMVKSDRYYLTTHELDHNDFIAQGNIRKMLECRARPDDRKAEAACKAARAQYEAVCVQSLRFFDVHLKGDAGQRAVLARHAATSWDTASRPSLVHVPRGVAGAEPFRLDSPTPPTPRQVRELMSRLGVEPALEILKRYHAASPFAPVFHGSLGFAIIDELLATGRIRDAIAVNRVYAKFEPENTRHYFRIGRTYEKIGARSLAMDEYQKALLLDPDDAEAAERLKKLRESKPPAPAR